MKAIFEASDVHNKDNVIFLQYTLNILYFRNMWKNRFVEAWTQDYILKEKLWKNKSPDGILVL